MEKCILYLKEPKKYAFEDTKQMGLSGESPLGEVKTKAPKDNHRDAPPVAARQAEVARDYLKRAAKIDELNGHQLDDPQNAHQLWP